VTSTARYHPIACIISKKSKSTWKPNSPQLSCSSMMNSPFQCSRKQTKLSWSVRPTLSTSFLAFPWFPTPAWRLPTVQSKCSPSNAVLRKPFRPRLKSSISREWWMSHRRSGRRPSDSPTPTILSATNNRRRLRTKGKI
jgi:hypothetical protein